MEQHGLLVAPEAGVFIGEDCEGPHEGVGLLGSSSCSIPPRGELNAEGIHLTIELVNGVMQVN